MHHPAVLEVQSLTLTSVCWPQVLPGLDPSGGSRREFLFSPFLASRGIPFLVCVHSQQWWVESFSLCTPLPPSPTYDDPVVTPAHLDNPRLCLHEEASCLGSLILSAPYCPFVTCPIIPMFRGPGPGCPWEFCLVPRSTHSLLPLTIL